MTDLLQHWLCDVGFVDHDDDVVFVRMHDKTDETKPVEFAEIYLHCFTDEQRAKLSEGMCFHWRIYEGGKQEFELIEVPPLTPEEEADNERRAAELSRVLLGETR